MGTLPTNYSEVNMYDKSPKVPLRMNDKSPKVPFRPHI